MSDIVADTLRSARDTHESNRQSLATKIEYTEGSLAKLKAQHAEMLTAIAALDEAIGLRKSVKTSQSRGSRAIVVQAIG